METNEDSSQCAQSIARILYKIFANAQSRNLSSS